MENNEEKPWQDLGYANGWSKTPQCVIDSRKAGHKIVSKEIGRCLTQYTCEEGRWSYRVDSSD